MGVLGVDPFAESAFRPFVAPGPGSGGGVEPGVFLTVPGAALLSARARPPSWASPSATRSACASTAGPSTARIVGLLEPDDDRSASALQNLVVADVATAQEWSG